MFDFNGAFLQRHCAHTYRCMPATPKTRAHTHTQTGTCACTDHTNKHADTHTITHTHTISHKFHIYRCSHLFIYPFIIITVSNGSTGLDSNKTAFCNKVESSQKDAGKREREGTRITLHYVGLDSQ